MMYNCLSGLIYNRVNKPRNVVYNYITMADKFSCDEFKSRMKRTASYRKEGWIKDLVDKWEECESE